MNLDSSQGASPPKKLTEVDDSADPRAISNQTYFWDRLRGGAQGLAETCWQVFALLVAIRVFEADESLKRYIPAAMGVGLMISPLTLAFFSRLQFPISRIIGYLWLGVAGSLGGMIIAPNIVFFVIATAMAQIFATQAVPMLTHLYSQNYAANERGSRLSTTFLLGSLMGIIFGFFGGELLDLGETLYPILFGVGLIAALGFHFAVRNIPAKPAYTLESRNPIRSLSVVWEDKLFGIILLAWMLLGLGNLMMIPIRVEYLANPKFGINASNAQISMIMVSTVLAFRLLSTKVWGFLFDRVNVLTMRILLNICFFGSILLFFFTRNLWIIALGAAMLGLAFGGGGIIWTLYVTKLAPPNEVTRYMSVHGFLTGSRMAIAPFLGYFCMEISHPTTTAWFAMLLISISTFMFIPLRPKINSLNQLG